MAQTSPSRASPKWGPMTKTVIGLTLVAIVGAFLIWFRRLIGPLILTFVLAYLLYPLIKRFSEKTNISWRTATNLVYLVVVIVVVGVLTLAGFAIVQQIQSLLAFVQRFISNLPQIVSDLSTQVYQFGPFTINIGQLLDLQTLTNEVLSVVQSVLGQLGNVIRTFAGSAVVTFGWGLFVLLISYFLLAEAAKFSGQLVNIEIPGYEHDLHRLGQELRIVWNAFLRGQLTIILLVIFTYSILLNVLGLRFAIGIAIMAGLARFVPYVGPAITLIVTALVAFFQPYNYFGLQPIYYVALVIILMLIVDQIYDNYISPRIFGYTLNVHPAAILIAALIFANFIGVIGLVLAAPVVATLNLLSRYVFRKMFDLDPWPETETLPQPVKAKWERPYIRFWRWVKEILTRLKQQF
jgi:predicted PurR-regulated permease PerM